MTHAQTSNPMQQPTLQTIRRALKAVMDTHRGTSRAALAALDAGRAAYRGAFTENERARVLSEARRIQAEAPEGHFLRQTPEIVNFEQALDEMGTQLIDQALGPDA